MDPLPCPLKTREPVVGIELADAGTRITALMESRQGMRSATQRNPLPPAPEAAVAQLLGIPKDVHVNRVVGFGYADPARAQAPKTVARRRRPLEELVHRERW